MTNEELLVMGSLANEVRNLRADSKIKDRDIEMAEAKLREANIRCVAQESRAADACESMERLKAERDKLREERDSSRRKLGEWTRFINSDIYLVLHRYVLPRNTPKKVVALIDGICARMEVFANEHPLTNIEGGMMK